MAFTDVKKTRFPTRWKAAMKLQWLAEDVCAITYQTINRSVHQMIATFGDRGDPISYHNMAAAITGEWSLMETNAAGWKIVADSTGIHLENGTLQEDYAYSDAVPFGTLALALCRTAAAVDAGVKRGGDAERTGSVHRRFADSLSGRDEPDRAAELCPHLALPMPVYFRPRTFRRKTKRRWLK